MEPDYVQIIEMSGNVPLEKHKLNYDKFMNQICETAVQKQISLKRGSLGQLPSSFPKISGKDFTISYNDANQKIIQNIRSRNASQASSRAKVFKSFVNQMDQHHKRVNIQTMGLLGLQVKKLETNDKYRKRLSQKYENVMDCTLENCKQKTIDIQRITTAQTKQNFQATQTVNQMAKYNPIDLLCKKIDISKRDIPNTSKFNKSIYRKSSFRLKQRVSLLIPASSPNTQITSQRKQSRKKSNKNDELQVKKIKIIANPQFVNPIYEGRINGYRDFIFKMNYVHNIFVDFTKYDDEEIQASLKNQQKYRAYIGPGNNGALIRSLIKRRFWWIISEQKNKLNETNFIWTQLRHTQYLKKQEPSMFMAYSIDISSMLQNQTSQNIQRSSSASPVKRKKTKMQKDAFEDGKYFGKIFTQKETQLYHGKILRNQTKSYQQKKDLLKLKTLDPRNQKVHNHLLNNFYLGNKKALFYNLKQYYELIDENPFKIIPLTFHIKKGSKDPNYKRFVGYYKKRHAYIKHQQKLMQKGQMVKRKMRNVWIVKPGQLTNRGNGITVIDQLYQLNSILKRESKHDNGTQKTFIVQLYIDRPFLYQKRKFDIRHYVLVTHLHGIMRAYWFNEGYIRTCSYQFDIDNFQRQIHLTNDAVQKYTPLYGRYEPANKLSYLDFQRYLDATYPKKKYNFEKSILTEMKQITTDAIKSSYLKLSPQRLKHNFQVFGMDFMIDCDFKPWLIQINTNPCLEINCPLLARLIPQMLDQSFRLSLDLVFPPPCHYPNTSKHLAPQAGLESLKYELIFDQKRDGPEIRSLYKQNQRNLLQDIGQISEEDEIYEDDGKDIMLDGILN